MVKGYAKTEQVQTTLTPRWRDRLDAYAAWREQSRADAIRTLIVDGLERHDFQQEAAEEYMREISIGRVKS